MTLCECGCGKPSPIAVSNCARSGWVKGKPMRFIRGHNNNGRTMKQDRWRVEDRGYMTPCWTWQLWVKNTGYGEVKVRGKRRLAHRVVYEQHRGAIPAGLELDHLCRNPNCVNPDHLEPVTHATNIQRGRPRKLTDEQMARVLSHPGPAWVVAKEVGISTGYAQQLRCGYARPRYSVVPR